MQHTVFVYCLLHSIICNKFELELTIIKEISRINANAQRYTVFFLHRGVCVTKKVTGMVQLNINILYENGLKRT